MRSPREQSARRWRVSLMGWLREKLKVRREDSPDPPDDGMAGAGMPAVVGPRPGGMAAGATKELPHED